jgi:hypothetical protein
MAGHKIDKLSLKKYFEQHREQITAIKNWQHKTDEIVFGVHAIAPTIPLSAIRNAFVREKKNWLQVDEEVFTKLFVEE